MPASGSEQSERDTVRWELRRGGAAAPSASAGNGVWVRQATLSVPPPERTQHREYSRVSQTH